MVEPTLTYPQPTSTNFNLNNFLVCPPPPPMQAEQEADAWRKWLSRVRGGGTSEICTLQLLVTTYRLYKLNETAVLKREIT